MKWENDADTAIKRVPFFVRKRVRKKVEEEAQRQGASMVTMAHVTASQQRFMKNQEREVKGFQVETCFGAGGCPNRIEVAPDLTSRIETYLASLNLKEFMKSRVDGPLKMHHEFRITMADCPNACSRPQIVDIGIISAAYPEITDAPCSQCESCVTACKEEGITVDESGPTIDTAMCLGCGHCVTACPEGTLAEAKKGYRILLGGKLGRRPQLGYELEGIFSPDEVMEIIRLSAEHFMAHNTKGERFGEIVNRTGFEFLSPHKVQGE